MKSESRRFILCFPGKAAPPISLPERIDHLGTETGRKTLVRHAIVGRQRLLRHVKGAEEKIENGECGGEVSFAAVPSSGVMPTVEYRTGEQVTERSQRPIQI